MSISSLPFKSNLQRSLADIFTLRKFLESLSTLRSPQKSGEFLENSPKALRTNSEIFQGEPLQKLSTKNHVFSYFPKMNNLTGQLYIIITQKILQ